VGRDGLPTGGQMATDDGRTDVLAALRGGGREAVDRVVPLLYDELRQIAHRHLMARGDGATLTTTALVHEAYLKLVDQSRAQANDRAHFLALAAVAMRHILLDRAKARTRTKRGGARQQITLDETVIAMEQQPDALLAVNEALDAVAKIDPRLARVVECRFFGGLTNEEIAEALNVTVRTVERDWVKARVLLRRELAA
jgi:RNA polymerase sigma factor (TIGR02999 family)